MTKRSEIPHRTAPHHTATPIALCPIALSPIALRPIGPSACVYCGFRHPYLTKRTLTAAQCTFAEVTKRETSSYILHQ